MGEVIVITSGKGGVGKTTTTANLGSALALEGRKMQIKTSINKGQAFSRIIPITCCPNKR